MLIAAMVLSGLFALFVVYFIVVVFSPWIREYRQPVPAVPSQASVEHTESLQFRDVRFVVSGVDLAGRLYLPSDSASPVPCIVMNNGLGGTMDAAVGPFARRFCGAGFAALIYDYRHFGKSAGEPRQLLSTDLQIADCRAAVQYARSLPEIDPERIAIWGTSAAGGYGLVVAAEDGRIACVCSQCGSLDHGADGKLIFKREGIRYFLKLFVHAARDKGRSRFGLSPHHIAIVGLPGTPAIFTFPGILDECAPVFGPEFDNRICGRALLTPHGKTSSNVIDKVQCPVLIQICEKDALVSLPGSLGMAKRLGALAEVKTYPAGHFDIYLGEHFERSIADQIEFFGRHLRR